MRISDWSSDVCSSDLRSSARTLRQPLVDGAGYFLLRAAGDVDADVAAAERQFGIVLASHQILQPLRRGRRHQVVLRSAARRVGKECVSTCRSRGSPFPETKNTEDTENTIRTTT